MTDAGRRGLRSMTGFASRAGAGGGWEWLWDLRAVNGRGLDLRLRLPDGAGALEPRVRAALGGRIARGSVTLSLRLVRRDGAGAAALDEGLLAAALAALTRVETEAERTGVTLRHSSAADLLALRGMFERGMEGALDVAPDATVVERLMADLATLIGAFDAMRASEGAALGRLLAGQIDRIEALATDAATVAAAREAETAARLRANLARVLENTDGADPDRVAQELAMLAIKADVAEEIDRLHAHLAAARALLAGAEPAGRRLEFLAQEFLREANTLCSKSGSVELTRIGLDLKAAIDQVREQVQNVE